LGQDAGRLIALKACVLVERAVDRLYKVGLVCGFLVVRFAGHRGAQIDHFARVFIDQEHVLIRGRFLLPAVMRGLFRGLRRALAATFRPGPLREPPPA
jgi:hypothetical protein